MSHSKIEQCTDVLFSWGYSSARVFVSSRLYLELPLTSAFSDFIGFEEAELKVIVAKSTITITNQTLHFEFRCFKLSLPITLQVT